MEERPEDPMRLWTGSWSPTKVKVTPPAPEIDKAEEPAEAPEEKPKSG